MRRLLWLTLGIICLGSYASSQTQSHGKQAQAQNSKTHTAKRDTLHTRTLAQVRVIDEETRKPLQGVIVVSKDKNTHVPYSLTKTDAKGSATFFAPTGKAIIGIGEQRRRAFTAHVLKHTSTSQTDGSKKVNVTFGLNGYVLPNAKKKK